MDDPRADGEIEFHHVKSASFRVVHVDGVYGGPAPAGNFIHMAVYSERSPIPRKIVHSVTKGQLGPELVEKREGRSGVFREIETDLVMNLDVARSLVEWLQNQIRSVEETNEMIASVGGSATK